MASVDIFVMLKYVQFEKGGFQNRYKLSNSTIVTKSVWSGLDKICDKDYVGLEDKNYLKTYGERSLYCLNMRWINAIKDTLNIDTQIMEEPRFCNQGEWLSATDRLIAIIKNWNGTTYVTNPDAKNKYLDEEKMKAAGIEIEYCNVPKHLQIHTFEAFEKFGIDGTMKQLKRVAKVYA